MSDHDISLDTEIRPNIYERIFNRKCHHELKEGAFGSESINVFKDGISLERRYYQSRINAIAVLYSVFMRLPDKPLAKRTYELIDLIVPMNQEDDLQKVYQLEKMKASDGLSDEKLKEYFPFVYPMYLRIQELREFADRLRDVESENQWDSLLNELIEHIENIKI